MHLLSQVDKAGEQDDAEHDVNQEHQQLLGASCQHVRENAQAFRVSKQLENECDAQNFERIFQDFVFVVEKKVKHGQNAYRKVYQVVGLFEELGKVGRHEKANDHFE